MRFPISILLIFHFNECALNPTFVDKELPWINATQYCKDNGFIMESNETEIKTWLKKHGERMDIEKVWLGKYKELTEWAYIRGCYGVTIDKTSNPSDIGKDRLLCQRLCKDQKYFGVKNNFCVCLQDVTRFKRRNCSDLQSMIVWEHKLMVYDSKNYGNENKLCIAANACENGYLEIKYHDCSSNYRKICDDGHSIPYDEAYNQQDGASLCHERGSFIKWFTDADCPLDDSAPHWTSGRRELDTFTLHKYNEIDRQRILKCYEIDDDGDVTEYNTGQCTSKSKTRTFLCRKENRYDLVKPGFPYISKDSKQDMSSAAGIAVGTVIVVVAVLAAVIASVVIFKRRTKRNEQKPTQSGKKDKYVPTFSKTVTSSNAQSNLHNPTPVNIEGRRLNSNFPANTVTSANINMSPNYSRAKPIENKRESDNYSFAQPTEVGSDYVYNSDNDHLNSSLKQTGDSDYSLSGHTMVTNNDKVGTYDHFSSFEKEDSGGSNSNYDHLPTNVGSDPTYDVSGRMVHDDSDKYDHLPSNFKHTTTNDYE